MEEDLIKGGVKKSKDTNIAPYLNVGTTAFNLLGNSIKHFDAGNYNPTQFSQYNTLDSLQQNSTNTAHLNIEENNVAKDTLSGVASGALAGAGVGGWVGAGVGAVVGGISQLLTSTLGNDKKREEERERYQDHLLGIESQAKYIKDRDYYNQIYYGNFYKEGGKFNMKGKNNDVFNESFLKYSGLKNLILQNKNNVNVFEYGGGLTPHHSNGVTKINNGGTHEENKLGGVPISIGENGLPNLVEEGEVIWNNYVFSNSLKPTKEILEELSLDKKYKNKSFSKIASDISKESEERPYNPISILGLKEGLGKLMIAQELIRSLEDSNMQNQPTQANIFDVGGAITKERRELLNTIMGLEGGKNGGKTINDYGFAGFYQMGAQAIGSTGVLKKDVVKALDKMKTNKERNKVLTDRNNWVNGEDYDAFMAGDKDFQERIANSYVDVLTKKLKNSLGADLYNDLVNSYGENNVITSAWLAGPGNFKKIINGEKTNLKESEHQEAIRRLVGDNSGSINNSSNANVTTSNAEDFKADLSGEYKRNPNKSLVNQARNYDTEYNKWVSEQKNNGTTEPLKLTKSAFNAFLQENNPDLYNNLIGRGQDEEVDLTGLNLLSTAPIVGKGISYLSALAEEPEVVQYDRITPERLNDRIDYRPTNNTYLADRVMNQYEATRRNILNTTGGNRGIAQYVTMQNDKNLSESLNEAFLKAEEYNRNSMLQAKEFNSRIAQINSQSDLQAQQVNANISMQEQNQNAINRAGLRSYRSQLMGSMLEDVSGLAKQLRWEKLSPIIYGYDSNGRKNKNTN